MLVYTISSLGDLAEQKVMELITTYIALLRGINVGGNNKLPMKKLVTVLEGLGLENIRTYIQSCNVVFDGNGVPDSLAAMLGAAISNESRF